MVGFFGSKINLPKRRYIRVQGRRQRGAVVPAPPFKICAPISCLASWLLQTSNIVFKKCGPLVVLAPPTAKFWRRACQSGLNICTNFCACKTITCAEDQNVACSFSVFQKIYRLFASSEDRLHDLEIMRLKANLH